MTDRSVFTITGHTNPTDLLTLADGQAVFATTSSRAYVSPLDYSVVTGAGHGAANDTALLSMFADLRAKAVNIGSPYQGTIPIRFPAGYFEFSSTIDLTDGTFIIEGASVGAGGGVGTWLQFPAGVTGFRVQRYNTSGATGTRTAAFGADGSIIRGLFIRGSFSSTEAEAHGIHLRARAKIENVRIANFEGDGIYANATAPTDNANNVFVSCCRLEGNRNGIFVDGADTNIWAVMGVDASANRRWGFLDSSFLGNSYFACHADSNGVSGGPYSSFVSNSGKRYYARKGGTWSNAPSGTTADTADWYYVDSNAATAWSGGGAYRDSGSYRGDGEGNAGNLFSGCYHELGQALGQIDGPAVVVGGSMRGSVKNLAVLSGDNNNVGNLVSSGGFTGAGNFTGYGTQHGFGPITGAADLLVQWNNTNSRNDHFFYQSAVLRGFHGTIGADYYCGSQSGSLRLYAAGAIAATVTNTGIVHQSGYNPTFTEYAAASVPTPGAGTQTLFIDTADHKLKRKDSSGTVTIMAPAVGTVAPTSPSVNDLWVDTT